MIISYHFTVASLTKLLLYSLGFGGRRGAFLVPIAAFCVPSVLLFSILVGFKLPKVGLGTGKFGLPSVPAFGDLSSFLFATDCTDDVVIRWEECFFFSIPVCNFPFEWTRERDEEEIILSVKF